MLISKLYSCMYHTVLSSCLISTNTLKYFVSLIPKRIEIHLS